MAAKFFDRTVPGSVGQTLESIGNVIASSTRYSIIGEDTLCAVALPEQ